jgi:CheY-like chemotaxis protein
MALVRPVAAERGLGLRVVNAVAAPKHFETDPARLRQVLVNLLGNAVKFTDTGGVELRVLGGATPGSLRFEVADTGHGIDEVSRAKLFQDFERLAATPSVEGTGLGLAISARLVRLMGGAIGHSPNADGGSIFWVELPAREPAVAALPAAETAKTASPGGGWHLLLVDDIKINLDIIAGFLHSAGHTVVLAESGLEALLLASEQCFDLILMDVRMVDMDGLEVTRRIRKLPAAHGAVPILALTAYNSHDQVAECLDAGMDGHVPKPLDYATLMRAIDDTIALVPSTRMTG